MRKNPAYRVRKLRKQWAARPSTLQPTAASVNGGAELAELRPINAGALHRLHKWTFPAAYGELYDDEYLGLREATIRQLIFEFHEWLLEMGVKVEWSANWRDCDKFARMFVAFVTLKNILRIQNGGVDLPLALGVCNFTQGAIAPGRHCVAYYLDEHDRFCIAEATPGYAQIVRAFTEGEEDLVTDWNL